MTGTGTETGMGTPSSLGIVPNNMKWVGGPEALEMLGERNLVVVEMGGVG